MTKVNLIPAPKRAEDVFAWAKQWIAANEHLPVGERYAALSGALQGVLYDTMREREREVAS